MSNPEIDARGPRFGAAITTIVLAVAFLTPGTALATALLLIQATAFGLGAIVGLQWALGMHGFAEDAPKP